ncbi:MAG TPA: hypothetical protein PKX36_02360 [Candidatus Cloacimonadota bacterium]|nr:hypothetical protein [Candidatus Cloacimonadota bacterium]
MKRLIPFILLLIFTLPLMAQPNLPRIYVQKLTLDNGKLPFVTWLDKVSAPEYILEAWIKGKPGDLMSTETHSYHHLAVAQIGDGIKMPFTLVARVQLGNFKYQWESGETLHLKLTHKATNTIKEWDVLVPEGSALIRYMDNPIVIPPYTESR